MPSRKHRTSEDVAAQKGLGLAVERLRRDVNMTREQVAKRGGLTIHTISAVESGEQEPTWGNLRRIAQGLGVRLEELNALAIELAPGEVGARLRRREKEAGQKSDQRLEESPSR
jgi:transcriptional regulator with XRE-family HTH domain